MDFNADQLKDQIPYYLTRAQKDGLVKALSDFPEKMNYYTGWHKSELLQGDGWSSLTIINFHNCEKKNIKGIIISNSCDVSQENQRDATPKLIFSPIIKLESYVNKLKESGLSEEKIKDKVRAIKEQKITSIFYLPQQSALDEDYIAILDDIHSIPAPIFWQSSEKQKIFTLSQVGFYLFIMKLSIHFCRFHEKVFRDEEH